MGKRLFNSFCYRSPRLDHQKATAKDKAKQIMEMTNTDPSQQSRTKRGT